MDPSSPPEQGQKLAIDFIVNKISLWFQGRARRKEEHWLTSVNRKVDFGKCREVLNTVVPKLSPNLNLKLFISYH
jgi:hypothetical protein